MQKRRSLAEPSPELSSGNLRWSWEATEMAGQPSDLWDLESYLTQSRKEIDRKYDYRYSALTLVFGKLIREGRFSEEELHDLAEDKIASIRSYVNLWAHWDTAA